MMQFPVSHGLNHGILFQHELTPLPTEAHSTTLVYYTYNQATYSSMELIQLLNLPEMQCCELSCHR